MNAHRRGTVSVLSGALALMVLLAACSAPPTATSSPTATAAPTPPPSPTPSRSPPPAVAPTREPAPIREPIATPTPTPVSSPTPTPAGPATPTPTAPPPAPTTTPTPIPTATPRSAREPAGNLAWARPSGWGAPLSFTNNAGRKGGAEASLGEQIYVSWAITNDERRSINEPFDVHLYLGGVFLASWRPLGMSVDFFQFVEDWEGIESVIRLEPGEHTLRLIIDPYDEIAETDESDNLIDLEIVVTGEPEERAGERLPDLTPVALDGWDGPLVVNAHAGRFGQGPLSVDLPTYVSVAAENLGVTSVLQDVAAHLYVDGVLVFRWTWQWARPGDRLTAESWDGLLDLIDLAPGEHEIRVVFDPGDLVHESDETNNDVTLELTWGTGPIAAAPPIETPPQPTPPSPLTLPDLAPSWRFGTGGPIVVSSVEGTRTSDPLVIGRPSFVDVAVVNQSTVDAGVFAVDLYVDGVRVNTFRSSDPLSSGVTLLFSDWDRLATLRIGPHVLRIVIDPDDSVAEHDETNNTFEFAIASYGSPPPAQPPATFSPSEIDALLAQLPGALDNLRPVLGEGNSGLSGLALDIADAGYFMLTGTSTRDEALDILLFDRAGYEEWIDESFAEQFATAPAPEYDGVLERRERLKADSPAFKTRHRGVVTIVVDAERPFAEVLDSLAHELGHAKQDFDSPTQSGASANAALDGIQEAQAQQFARALWLTLESRLGTPLLMYPLHAAYQRVVDADLDRWFEDHASDEHWLGYVIQWVAPFADPELRDVGDELVGRGALTALASLAMFDRWLAIEPGDAEAYVDGLLAALPSVEPTIRAIASSRLVIGLTADEEGIATLSTVGLTTP